MSTIMDVEKKSGVSHSTISRYLNGKNVTEENRIKIEKAIAELSYERNPMASGLKARKSYTVGMVLPSINDPFFPKLVEGFQTYMRKHGYQTIINSADNDPKQEIEQVQILANKRVDGLVVASVSKDGAHIRECLDNGLPVILLDRLIDGLKCDSVTVDNYRAAYDAVSLCVRKGHSRFAFLGSEYYTDLQRYKGFQSALKKAGLEIPEEYTAWASISNHDSVRKFMRLLNLASPPDLVFCSNIYHTLGVLEAMLEYKIEIPEEVSILSFDSLEASPFYEFTKCIRPRFTSICQPHEQISIETAKLLLKRIKEGVGDYEPVELELPTSFEIGESIKDLNAYSAKQREN